MILNGKAWDEKISEDEFKKELTQIQNAVVAKGCEPWLTIGRLISYDPTQRPPCQEVQEVLRQTNVVELKRQIFGS